MKKLNIDEQKLIELFNSGLTSQQIADQLNIKRSTIEARKRKLGLKRSNSFYKKKLFIEDFFHDIDTEAKAYWLGFMFADGCVLERKTSKIIKIAVQDKEICDKFLKDINANFQTMTFLEKDMYNPNKKREVYHVELFSKEMFEDLYKLGCVPRKSLILKFPIISKNVIRHFIRGYFDGDGCITYAEQKNQNATSTKYYSGRIEFCGTKEFLTEMNKFLPNSFNLRKESRSKNNVYSASKSGGKNIEAFYNYLYKDSTVYLQRKKDKFETYFNLTNRDVQRV